ncbi:peptidoglycan-binding domain-containing protein [Rhizobium sp. SL42]|uniref:peptidoglycan-binding domain-containing protein n=1 Tax=Rhizobium sp. SL42 TaxID=2806346 RepID=UPI001F350CF5|nr:peptidoglycan-binding domain-containing protein [Rhizobium sp. SL42]UJW76512.1 peptidoglycan-binding protein [Rhizobium sp. SL42]
MTKRTRKSPEKKKKPTQHALGLLSAGVTALARLAGRHPRLVGGLATFAVIFGTVAANALWYQPGQHPSPFLRTRDAANFSALAGVGRAPHLAEPPHANVTTFKIAREGEQDPAAEAAAPVEDSLDVAAVTPAAAIAETAAPTAAPATSTDWPVATGETAVLIRDVQAELSRRGLYDGDADGVIGPRTETAIAVFQKSVGMEPNGLVSAELVAALRVDRSVTAAVPAQRPAPDLVRDSAGVDPVAAAIRRAETQVVTAPRREVAKPSTPTPVPPGEIRATAARPDAPLPVQQASFDPGLVMEIQRGLSNMAYSDVTIDGVPGEQTRNAIRRFERHYKMAETGEPSAVVLKKLKSIGAL